MATALKAIGTLALGSHRGLLETLQGHSLSRKLTSTCDTNICGRKLTDAKACADFGTDNKDCTGTCLTGYVASGDSCAIDEAIDLKGVSAADIFATGMGDGTDWTDAVVKRKQRKKNVRNWFKDALVTHKAKAANSGKINRVLRKELRLALDKSEDFSDAARAKLATKPRVKDKTVYMKPGPVNKDDGDTCATDPTAEDDSCVTTLLEVDGDGVDKNVLGCDDGCWQVGGFLTPGGVLTPAIRQTRASADADYSMACWTGSAWEDQGSKAPGEELACKIGARTVTVLVDSMIPTDDVTVAEYHSDSLVPRGTTSKTFSANGLSAICDDEDSNSISMNANGDDVSVTFRTTVQADSSSAYGCELSVGVAHDTSGSDVTLRDAGLFQRGTAATATAQTNNGDGTYTFTVNVKSSSYQTDANSKLHVGRLGVTLTPTLTCDGALAVTLAQFGVPSSNGIALVENQGDAAGHAVHYDLVAQGMLPTDEAVTDGASGALGAHVDDAKRAYPYTASFTHFHDQVVFPEQSIDNTKSITDHFHGLVNPQVAKCQWATPDYHADLLALQETLKTNVWMANDDGDTPTQTYGAWTEVDCSAGICNKLQKSATVNGADAYLPFDKPLTSYYATQPSVECTSQDGASGAVSTTLTPALAGDNAPAMLSALVVKHDTLAKVDCTKNTVDTDICLAPTTDRVIGELFTMQDVTDDFDNLLTDTYDFNLAASCSSDGAACEITDITGAAGRVSSKGRATVVSELGALAQAVKDTTFALPGAYGTTFSNFDASVSGGSTVSDSTNKYRADHPFGVTISAVGDTLSWTGDVAIANFLGEGEVNAIHGTPAETTETRVSAAAVAGYMKTASERVFVDGEMMPFAFADSYDPGKTTNPVDSTQCQTATDTVMCKSNGFDAVDCLSRTLTVTYSVTTPTEDDRFPASTAVATKTWHVDGPGSAAQADVGFSITAPTPQTGIAGIQINAAGSTTDGSNVNTAALTVSTGNYMGSDNITFTRDSQTGTTTYNCESAPETIEYTASVAAPCGDIAAYEITSDLEAHYVYSAAQVQQDSTTAHTTTEWHVQESSSTGDYKIPIPIIIENPTDADGNHLPADQVTVSGLSVNVGSVQLRGCAVNDAGKQECVVEYYNDATYDVRVGESCGDSGPDGQPNTADDEPACPVISYNLVASVRNGNVAGAFGEAAACGAGGAAPAASVISAKSLTLTVVGDPQAYDGVIDVHAKVGTGDEKPYPIASEDQHLAAVPGKDGAAITILDMNTDETQDAHIDASKNIAFRIEYLKTGKGARTFQIAPLDVDADTWGEGAHSFNLPSLRVCDSADYENGACVSGSGGGVDGGSGIDCSDPWVDSTVTPLVAKSDCKDEFYVSLGDDTDTDICQNTPVGSDPYTYDGKPYLGFSIQVTYLQGGEGAADSETPHKYMFALKCPAKDYSLNIAQQIGTGTNRKIIPEDGNIGLVDKNVFAQSHDDKITLKLFFAGRSQNGAKQPLRLVANDDVKMIDPLTGGDAANGEISGDLIGDKFESAQPVTFQFKKKCLFTELHLISQMSDLAADTDKFFKFKLQCPRFSGTSTFDSLNLDYTITGTKFTNDGGSVNVTQPSLTNPGGKDFTSITTGLVGTSCEGAIKAGCEFGSAAGIQTLDGGSESIAEWFNYLKSCDFDESGGVYYGAVQRTYTRANRIGGAAASYCGGRDLSFGVIMSGTHTATLSVESPKEMDFAVEVLELAWQDCDAGSGAASGKKLHAVIELQRRFVGEGVFTLASGDAITEQVLSGFHNATQVASHDTATGRLAVEGQCIANPANEGGCGVFTDTTREINFGIVHTSNGIDYRGDLEVDLALSCPLGELEGNENSQIPMHHTSKCSGYGSAIEQSCLFDGEAVSGDGNCVDANTDGACDTAVVSADGQIELELIITDAAFDEHDISAPTYEIAGGASGNVADLTSEYVANDGTADIPLVSSGTPDGSGPGEENSKVTLRALALSGKTVTISWDVTRVAANGASPSASNSGRRMLRQTVSYTLGADGSSSEGAAFVVFPATREGESDSISVSEALSEAEASAGTTHTHEHHVDDHHEEGWGLWVFAIVGGGLLVTVVLVAVFSNGQKEVVYTSTAAPVFASRNLKSRFYSYSRLGGENGFDRNRFRN